MVEKTLGGEGCQDEGDFLKWSQAEWTLVGQVGYFQFLGYFFIQASLDTADKGAICTGAPPFTLYLAQFLHMEAFELNTKECHHKRHSHQHHHHDQHHNHHVWQRCMHHCEKLGSRAPPVVTSDQWVDLSQFLKPRVYESKEVFWDEFISPLCFVSFHLSLMIATSVIIVAIIAGNT